MSTLLATELAIRVAATAVIVIAVTLAVERLGPLIGGALAGSPIVIGPGFFFIAREHDADFIADTAAASLLSLCATEAFLLAYSGVAFRHRSGLALSAASLVWFLAAAMLAPLPAYSTASGHLFQEYPAGRSMNIRPPRQWAFRAFLHC